jgi:hypothetical protein
MSIKGKTKDELQKTFFFARKKPYYPLSFALLVIILSLVVVPTPLAQVEGYTIVVDQAVDADSNVDAVANIGDDGATSYLNAQTQNDDDQIITEGQGAGYVAGNDVEDFMDDVNDDHAPTDLGTYSDWTEMQDIDDTYNTLTEENTGGAGVDEWLICNTSAENNGFDSTYQNWDGEIGTSPYLDAIDYSTNYIYEEKTGGATIGWFYFPSTTGGTGDYTVNISLYLQGDGNDWVDPFVDYTGSGGGADAGNIVSPSSWAWVTLSLGTRTQAEVNNLRVYLQYSSSAKGNQIDVDMMRVGVYKAGADNYQFDREFAFGSLDFDETNEYLCIKTGTIGTETLDIDIWHSGAWTDIGTDIVDANDNTWVNISISTWLDATAEEFRFQGATEASDTTENTWQIDGILIHSWTDAVDDYELEWEHQTNVDIDKDGWMLTIYGYYSDTTEEIEIQLWDWVGTSWSSPLATTITETEQWYNISISDTYVDTTNEWITYRFRDTDKALDSDQDTLYLDYSGVRAWNMSTYWHEFTLSPTNITQNSDYWDFTDSPFSFQIEAGATYDVQIKGADVTGTPVASNWIFFNTVDDSGTSTQLTTSYQNLYVSQSAGNNTHTVYLWINLGWSAGDPALADSYNKLTVTVYIVPA